MIADRSPKDPHLGIERREEMDSAGQVALRGLVIGAAVGGFLFAGLAWWRQARRTPTARR